MKIYSKRPPSASHKKSSTIKFDKGKIFNLPALEFLAGIDSETAMLVFIDPPFNLGKEYGPAVTKQDRMPEQTYSNWLRDVILECTRILKPGGTLYLYHLPKWAMQAGTWLEAEIEFRHWIAVSMKNGFARGKRLYPAHYALLMFTKGDPEYFARPKIPLQRCRHCNGIVKDYGGYLSIVQKKGLNLSDIWDDLSPVRHKTTKNRSANELPKKLYDRVFAISAATGGLFVEPFAGSGTGVLVAISHGMRFSVNDIEPENCQLINDRIKKEI